MVDGNSHRIATKIDTNRNQETLFASHLPPNKCTQPTKMGTEVLPKCYPNDDPYPKRLSLQPYQPKTGSNPKWVVITHILVETVVKTLASAP